MHIITFHSLAAGQQQMPAPFPHAICELPRAGKGVFGGSSLEREKGEGREKTVGGIPDSFNQSLASSTVAINDAARGEAARKRNR